MTNRPAVPESIDEYIETRPKDVRAKLQRIRTTIRRAAPHAEEGIRYQIPTFILHGNLISFAAYKDHIGLYPAPEGSATFNCQIAPYRAARSTVRIPLDKPIPYSLIRQMVRLRVMDNRRRAEARAAKKAK
jgi:uncharacterized protein YdhG (YjbR/CyaY superfamily)